VLAFQRLGPPTRRTAGRVRESDGPVVQW
jgi:hypothetical protein